jgi:hypothetical protein
MVARASISSVTRITPSCAVIADPERPATRIATSTWTKLAHDAQADDVDDEDVGAELLELQAPRGKTAPRR